MAQRDRRIIWERIERSARGPRPALTHDKIARAAVAIADADGLAAVSMRRLAERLGVSTMGLYRYVDGKDDVYELMIDAVYGEIEPPAGDWRTVARSLAEQTRRLALRHPWLAHIRQLVPNALLTPNLLALFETMLISIEDTGLDVDTMTAVFGMIMAFVTGAASAEVAERESLRRRGWPAEKDPRLAYLPQVRWMMGTGRYPMVTKYIVEGSNKDDAEWGFQFGLDCVLDGIASRLGI